MNVYLENILSRAANMETREKVLEYVIFYYKV